MKEESVTPTRQPVCKGYWPIYHGSIKLKLMQIYRDVKTFNTKKGVTFLKSQVLVLDLYLLSITIRIPYKLFSRTFEEIFASFDVLTKPKKKPTKKKAPKKK